MEGVQRDPRSWVFGWVRTRKACDNPESASRSERQLLSFLSPKCSLALLLLPPSPSTPIVPVSTQTRPCRREGPLHLPTHQLIPIACKQSTIFFVRISYVIRQLFTTFTYLYIPSPFTAAGQLLAPGPTAHNQHPNPAPNSPARHSPSFVGHPPTSPHHPPCNTSQDQASPFPRRFHISNAINPFQTTQKSRRTFRRYA